jgi:hypothetical protein
LPPLADVVSSARHVRVVQRNADIAQLRAAQRSGDPRCSKQRISAPRYGLRESRRLANAPTSTRQAEKSKARHACDAALLKRGATHVDHSSTRGHETGRDYTAILSFPDFRGAAGDHQP